MTNITKLRKKLKFSNYFSIFKNNKAFFICLHEIDSSHGMHFNKKNLIENGFSLKFLDIKKLKRFSFFNPKLYSFNGRILLIYKKDLHPSDNQSIIYVLKNFPVILFSYDKVFYSKKRLLSLIKKKQKLDIKHLLFQSKSLISISFFSSIQRQIENYRIKLSS